MSDSELHNKIKSQVLTELGVKLSNQDPVFSLVIANREVLSSVSASLNEVLNRLPGAISESVKGIVLAVENTEQTVGSIRDETKGMLSALAKFEVEKAHQQVKEIVISDINAAFVDSLTVLKKGVSDIEIKIQNIGKSVRYTKLLMVNVLLSACLTSITIFSGWGLYALYSANAESVASASLWYDKYQKQQKAIDSLPPVTKKALSEMTKSF